MGKAQRVPNFFILGIPKAGTTSLHHYLRQHPDVFLPYTKEPAFFSSEKHYSRGLEWYLETFFPGAEPNSAVGEATPWYFCNEKCIERISRDLPPESHRFIVIFRDPVARAYSMYWDLVSGGVETGSFEEGLALEEERLKDPSLIERGSYTVGYRYVGNYASHLRNWLAVFPRDRFLLLLQEDLAADPALILRRIFDFLAIDDLSQTLDAGTRHNVASSPRNPRLRNIIRHWESLPRWTRVPYYWLPKKRRLQLGQFVVRANQQADPYPPMNPETEVELRDYFMGEVLEMENIMGRDLSHWKGPPRSAPI